RVSAWPLPPHWDWHSARTQPERRGHRPSQNQPARCCRLGRDCRGCSAPKHRLAPRRGDTARAVQRGPVARLEPRHAQSGPCRRRIRAREPAPLQQIATPAARLPPHPEHCLDSRAPERPSLILRSGAQADNEVSPAVPSTRKNGGEQFAAASSVHGRCQYLLCDHAVVKANGTRICALLEVSPHTGVSSGCGFLTTTCSLPAWARSFWLTTKFSLVPLCTLVGTG